MHNIAPMTEDQEAIRDAVAAVCAQFDAEYWRKTDETGEWPEAFTKEMADGGWLGIAMPEEVGGSGLGLAICRGLVEVMGGVIDYDQTPAGGTTFWMELPLELAPNHDATPAAKPLAGQRIVLVDGDPTQRECLSQSVRLLGAEVRAFADSAAAATAAAWASCTLVERGMSALGGNAPTVCYSPLGGPAESAELPATSATSPRQLLLPARLEQLSSILSGVRKSLTCCFKAEYTVCSCFSFLLAQGVGR